MTILVRRDANGYQALVINRTRKTLDKKKKNRAVYTCNECEYVAESDAIHAQLQREIHERVTGHKLGQIQPAHELSEDWWQGKVSAKLIDGE